MLLEGLIALEESLILFIYITELDCDEFAILLITPMRLQLKNKLVY